MKLVRGNEGERERERERPEHIVCVQCFSTCILYVITREREKGDGLVTPKTVIVGVELYLECATCAPRDREI